MCSFCGRGWKTTYDLRIHERIHTGEKPFHCSDCMKPFRTRGSVFIHMRRVHRKEPVLKKTQLLLKVDNATEHPGNQLNKPPYKGNGDNKEGNGLDSCTLANEGVCSENGSTKEISKLVQKNGKLYQCPYCPRTFQIRCRIVDHIRYHTGERPYLCSMCPKAFFKGSRLNRHMKEHHGWEPTKEKIIHNELHQCLYCPKTCKKKSDLSSHMRYHTDERPYKCPVCPKAFHVSRSLTRHVKTSHDWEFLEDKLKQVFEQVRNGVVNTNPVRSDECNWEQNETTNVRKRNKRDSMNLMLYKLECSFCGKRWSRMCDLKQHERIHTGEKPFECSECKKAFSTRGSVYSHMRKRHRKEPSMKKIRLVRVENVGDNEDGNRIDNNTEGLAISESLRRDEENTQSEIVYIYKCSFCNAESFTSYQARDDHERTHKGEDDFESSPSKNVVIKRRVTTKNSKRWVKYKFKCSFCDKKWKSRVERRDHERIHTGDKPIACSVCNMSFRTRGSVFKHMRTIHKKEPVMKSRSSNVMSLIKRRDNFENEQNNPTIVLPENDNEETKSVMEKGVKGRGTRSRKLSNSKSSSSINHQRNEKSRIKTQILTNQNVSGPQTDKEFKILIDDRKKNFLNDDNAGKVEVKKATIPVESENLASINPNTVNGEETVCACDSKSCSFCTSESHNKEKDFQVDDKALIEPIVSVVNCEHNSDNAMTLYSNTSDKQSDSIKHSGQKLIKIICNGQVRLFTLKQFDCSECKGNSDINSSLKCHHEQNSVAVADSTVTMDPDQENCNSILGKTQHTISHDPQSSYSSSYCINSNSANSNSNSSCEMDINRAMDIIAYSKEFQKEIPEIMMMDASTSQTITLETGDPVNDCGSELESKETEVVYATNVSSHYDKRAKMKQLMRENERRNITDIIYAKE